ncbi:unnamed protein product [Brassica rapa subsp. trilocularis]
MECSYQKEKEELVQVFHDTIIEVPYVFQIHDASEERKLAGIASVSFSFPSLYFDNGLYVYFYSHSKVISLQLIWILINIQERYDGFMMVSAALTLAVALSPLQSSSLISLPLSIPSYVTI